MFAAISHAAIKPLQHGDLHMPLHCQIDQRREQALNMHGLIQYQNWPLGQMATFHQHRLDSVFDHLSMAATDAFLL